MSNSHISVEKILTLQCENNEIEKRGIFEFLRRISFSQHFTCTLNNQINKEVGYFPIWKLPTSQQRYLEEYST